MPGDHRQFFGNIARHFGRLQPWIDTRRISPNAAQQVTNFLVMQLIERDPVTLLIGEEAVAATITCPIEVKFETAPDIGDDQEGRGFVIVGQRQRIAFCLNPSVGHQPVIAWRFLCGRCGMADDIAEQVGYRLKCVLRGIRRNGFTGLDLTLLGLKDEAVAFVQVDAFGAFATVYDLGFYRSFKFVFAQPFTARVGRWQVKRMAKFVQEQRIVGAFGSAFASEPPVDKCT